VIAALGLARPERKIKAWRAIVRGIATLTELFRRDLTGCEVGAGSRDQLIGMTIPYESSERSRKRSH
jgi:hypothetical protein